MGRHFIHIRMLLPAIVLAGTMTFPMSAREHGLKKSKNLSLSIKGQDRESDRNHLNIGLMSNYQNLIGVSMNVISDVAHQKTSGFQASGLLNLVGKRSSGMQVAGLANISGIKSHGLRIGGLFNISGRSAYAVQISGMGNLAGINQKGFMLTGLINMSSVNAKGILISGMANITGNEQNGVAVGGLTSVSGGNMYGAQISSLMNVAGNSNKGLQLSALTNVSIINEGLQMGCLANYSDDNEGLQLGLANISGKGGKGVQIGIFNMNADSCARQVGMINLNPRTRTQVIISGGSLNKTGVAVRFKNRMIYTQLEAGMILGKLTDKASVSGTYRTGIAFPLVKEKLSLNTDLGYCHIETLANKGMPHRLYAIQPRLGIEYNPLRELGLFIAGGYSWTRTYKGNRGYSGNPVIEAGLVLF